MQIPPACAAWAEMMEEGEEQRRILVNLQREECLKKKVAEEFFGRLSRKGNPKTPKQAQDFAFEVVKAGKALFTCQGRRVPGKAFSTLFRMESAKDLRYRIPKALDPKGLRDDAINRLSDEDLRSVVEDYRDAVTLGSQLRIVWVTDFRAVEQLLDRVSVVADRLGMDLKGENRWVTFVYNRKGLRCSLRVPRSLDGIDKPRFQLVEDCSAKAGRTAPMTAKEAGLPEAVHRGCRAKAKMKLKVLT